MSGLSLWTTVPGMAVPLLQTLENMPHDRSTLGQGSWGITDQLLYSLVELHC